MSTGEHCQGRADRMPPGSDLRSGQVDQQPERRRDQARFHQRNECKSARAVDRGDQQIEPPSEVIPPAVGRRNRQRIEGWREESMRGEVLARGNVRERHRFGESRAGEQPGDQHDRPAEHEVTPNRFVFHEFRRQLFVVVELFRGGVCDRGCLLLTGRRGGGRRCLRIWCRDGRICTPFRAGRGFGLRIRRFRTGRFDHERRSQNKPAGISEEDQLDPPITI